MGTVCLAVLAAHAAAEPTPVEQAMPVTAPDAYDLPQAAGPDPFPIPETLAGNVAFWVKVFGEWGIGQAAIHDAFYPAIVYEVVPMTGRDGRIGEAQKAQLEARREWWRGWLYGLRQKVADGTPLDDIEKSWVLEITNHGGSDAVDGAWDRVRTQRGVRERFRQGLERSGQWDARMRAIFREADLPEDLACLPHVESSFEPSARSSVGAVGLWQFMRPSGKHYSLSIDAAIDERLDPIAATRAAARYLRDALDKLEAWPLALTSYNHGVNGMLRAKAQFGTDFDRIHREYRGPVFGFASRNFYAEFLAARQIAREPERFFPEGIAPLPPLDHDELVLSRRMTPHQLASRYRVPTARLAGINPAWTAKAVKSGLALPAGTQVWLPKGALAGAPAPEPEPAVELSSRAARPDAAVAVASDRTYTVRAGDTLVGIAQAAGTDVALVRALNRIPGGSSSIKPGQELLLPSASAGDGGPDVHVVRRGETLSHISRTHGVPLEDLLAVNGLSQRGTIQVGQTLRLAPRAVAVAKARHVVRRGETLFRIATSYGVSLIDLLSANELTPRSVIRPGQNLLIPSLR